MTNFRPAAAAATQTLPPTANFPGFCLTGFYRATLCLARTMLSQDVRPSVSLSVRHPLIGHIE